jgi:uridine kinase
MTDFLEKIAETIIYIDAAGKTTLADRLAARLRERRRSVIRASVVSFHNLPDTCHQRGKLSPGSYFYDSFDYEALKSQLLIPLKENRPFHPPFLTIAWRKNLHYKLLRPELIDHWDMKIFDESGYFSEIGRLSTGRTL